MPNVKKRCNILNQENLSCDTLDFQELKPLRIKVNKVCNLLDITRQHLHKIMECDPTFPKQIKSGSSKQSGVYFDYEEIMVWYSNWKMSHRNNDS